MGNSGAYGDGFIAQRFFTGSTSILRLLSLSKLVARQVGRTELLVPGIVTATFRWCGPRTDAGGIREPTSSNDQRSVQARAW